MACPALRKAPESRWLCLAVAGAALTGPPPGAYDPPYPMPGTPLVQGPLIKRLFCQFKNWLWGRRR